MPVTNTTSPRILSSCQAFDSAIFSTEQDGCNLTIINLSPLPSISNIEYEITLNGNPVDTINTTDDNYTWDAASLYSGEQLEITQTITAASGTFDVTQVVNMPEFDLSCVVIYQSDMLGASTFDPLTVLSSGSARWLMPDSSYISGAALSVLGSDVGFDGGIKTLRVHFTEGKDDVISIFLPSDDIINNIDLSGLENCSTFQFESNSGLNNIFNPASSTTILSYSAYDCDIGESLDLSPLLGLGGDVRIYNNPNLTSVTLPTSSTVFSLLQISDCDLTGSLNASGLSGLGGQFLVYGNPNLTSITNPTSSQTFSRYEAYNCDLTGILDVSTLSGLAGEFEVFGNSNLTGFSFPSTSNVFSSFQAYNCGLTGTIDFSNLTGLGGDVRVYGNGLLTGIIFPASSQTFSIFQATNCDITGTLDFSPLTDIPLRVFLQNNSNLTNVIHPVSSAVMTDYRINNCGLTGTFDLSNLTGLGGRIDLLSNPSLTDITFPASTSTITTLDIRSCDLGHVDITTCTFSSSVTFNMSNNSMLVAEVNEMLVDLDATLPAVGSGTITMSGTNAAPDGSSGGFNGTAAVTSLQGKGYTVITS